MKPAGTILAIYDLFFVNHKLVELMWGPETVISCILRVDKYKSSKKSIE